MTHEIRFLIKGYDRKEIMERLRRELPIMFLEHEDTIVIQAVDLVPKIHPVKENYAQNYSSSR